MAKSVSVSPNGSSRERPVNGTHVIELARKILVFSPLPKTIKNFRNLLFDVLTCVFQEQAQTGPMTTVHAVDAAFDLIRGAFEERLSACEERQGDSGKKLSDAKVRRSMQASEGFMRQLHIALRLAVTRDAAQQELKKLLTFIEAPRTQQTSAQLIRDELRRDHYPTIQKAGTYRRMKGSRHKVVLEYIDVLRAACMLGIASGKKAYDHYMALREKKMASGAVRSGVTGKSFEWQKYMKDDFSKNVMKGVDYSIVDDLDCSDGTT